MAKEYRQNANYEEINSGETEVNPHKEENHGNTSLPFGLCKRQGISLPDSATPRDAWNALKGEGITPEKVYKKLDKKEEQVKRWVKQRPSGYNGSVPKDKLDEYNVNALKSIQEDTNMSEKEAKQFQDNLIEYFGGSYEEYTNGNKPKEVKIIDEGIDKMPKYDGAIYRGMYLPPEQAVDFENLKEGDAIKMKSISSWSSEERVGEVFGQLDDTYGSSVLITCEKNKSGAGVQHISSFGEGEAEVLLPSPAKWEVIKTESVNKYDYLKDKWKGNNYLLGKLEKEKDDAMNAKIIKIFVKETL